jgi:hypothetical protein
MLAQAHGCPGSIPGGRSPVVLHPNASHGPPPPYDAGHEPVSGRRHRASPRDTVGARHDRVLSRFVAALGGKLIADFGDEQLKLA